MVFYLLFYLFLDLFMALWLICAKASDRSHGQFSEQHVFERGNFAIASRCQHKTEDVNKS